MAGLNGLYLQPQILQKIPALSRFAIADRPETVIGGGTAMDFVALLALVGFGLAVALLFRNAMVMSQNRRLGLLALTFGFSAQHLIHGGASETFLYFRF
jgi:hypothetical protein